MLKIFQQFVSYGFQNKRKLMIAEFSRGSLRSTRPKKSGTGGKP